jgi:hypothetical protein
MGYVFRSPTIYAYFALSAHNKRTVEITCRLSVHMSLSQAGEQISFKLVVGIDFLCFRPVKS